MANSATGRVFAHEIANLVPNLADNQAGKELQRLASAGLLAREPQEAGQSRNYFKRLESSYWGLAQNLVQEIESRAEDYERPRLVEPG